MTPKQSDPLKQSYDTLGERCLDILDKISPPPPRSQLPRGANSSQYAQADPKTASLHTAAASEKPPDPTSSPESQPPTPPRDLYALLREHRTSDPTLDELWTDLTTAPPWVDWVQIERGQNVFYRYGGACLTGLAYQSLLGGMGAARVVETLARTGGFSTKVARRRLFETTQHILQCTKSPEALRVDGEGFASSVRVRFLHAAVRRRILKLAESKEGYYDIQNWGVPINDLDSIATIGTFSATLIWLSLPRQGIFLTAQETEDYIALWRYIGHLLGTPNEYFSTPAKAKAMMESLLMNEIDPTDTSRLLANNIIRALDDQPPGYASADMLTASARWLNGSELSDRLGLSRPGVYYYVLVAGQCLFFMAFCYGYRMMPERYDEKKVKMLKRVFWQIVVESRYGLEGKETGFDFQYVPELGTVTEQAQDEEREKMRGVETRNLKAFVLGVGAMCGLAFVGYKITRGVVGLVTGAVRLVL